MRKTVNPFRDYFKTHPSLLQSLVRIVTTMEITTLRDARLQSNASKVHGEWRRTKIDELHSGYYPSDKTYLNPTGEQKLVCRAGGKGWADQENKKVLPFSVLPVIFSSRSSKDSIV